MNPLDLITGFLPDVWPILAAGLALVVGWFTARRSGVQKQKAKQAEARIKTMKKSEEVEDAVEAKTDAAVRGDLGRWVRPDE